MKKKQCSKWEKPELIILNSNNNDEVLTSNCKTANPSVGPSLYNNSCNEPNPRNLCRACQGISLTS